jgi:glycerol-3-phosphate dehydrogenase
MAQNAGHLVKINLYYTKLQLVGGYFYTIGLTIYDLLAGKLSLGSSKYIIKENH